MAPEDLTNLLNHYLTEMSRIALQHGATIDKFVGDAIVIFFGDPETHGVKEDALACVGMAVAMRDRMAELQSIWRTAGIERPLQCRIGINTGYCTVGNFGSDDRLDYTIIGPGVNLASRLESIAEPGEILISYETSAHVNDEFRCQSRGNVSVKGMAYPVAIYRVFGRREGLDSNNGSIHIDKSGFRLDIDLRSMSADQIDQVAASLRRALRQISKLNRATEKLNKSSARQKSESLRAKK